MTATKPRCLDDLIRKGGAIQMEDIIQCLFTSRPRPPCTYNLQLYNLQAPIQSILMSILMSGARILYGGQNLKIFDITKQQYNTLNEYIESIGFTIKYKENHQDEKLIGYNIWFEPFKRLYKCNGQKYN